MSRRNFLEGYIFNDIEVIKFIRFDLNRNAKYLIKCHCSIQKIMDGSKIKNGHIRSCGCLVSRKGVPSSNRLEKGEAHLNAYFAQYKSSALKRNYTFNISKEQFIEITSKCCYYCNLPPQPIVQKSKSHYGQYVGSGVDRKDNTVGYELGNCVPCCIMCNKMKRDYSYGDYIAKIRKIYGNLQLSK